MTLESKMEEQEWAILVVEDCQMIQEIIWETIKDLNLPSHIAIIFANTKTQAISILESRWDILAVLLDWDLWNWYSESFDILKRVLETQTKIQDIISISWDNQIRRLHVQYWATKQIPKENLYLELEEALCTGVIVSHWASHIEKIYDNDLIVYLYRVEQISKHVRSLLDDYFWNETAAISLGVSQNLQQILRVKANLLFFSPEEVVEKLKGYDFSWGTNPNKENLLKIFDTV